ncbi:MAG: FtsX-like permease family protein [Acidimicrobiia bacterium]
MAMWLLSRRELQFRSRRALVAVLVSALVFGIAVASEGIKRTLANEPSEFVDSFGADGWVVRRDASPFTTIAVLPDSLAETLADTPGVKSVHPILTGRATILSGTKDNANLIGYDLGDGPGPKLSEGRAPKGDKEIAITSGAGVGVGDTIVTTAGTFDVVGKLDGMRYNASAPTILMSFAGAQKAVLNGQPFAMGFAVQGEPKSLPKGTAFTTNAEAADDLGLTIKAATKTIDFIVLLTWIVAAGVIGAIVYLAALEQTRNFAILRATGSTGGLIVGSLLVQSLAIAISAAVLSVPLALLLRMGMPMPSTLNASSFLRILIVGLLIGGIASIAAVRRALRVSPAEAFGRA